MAGKAAEPPGAGPGNRCIFFPAGLHLQGEGLGSVGVRSPGTRKADLRKGPSTPTC